MPWQDDAANPKNGGKRDVRPLTDGFAVECSVLRCHDRGRDEHGNAGVVHASKAFHESLLGDAAHCMPHAATNEAFACCEEECCGKEDIRLGRSGKVDG